MIGRLIESIVLMTALAGFASGFRHVE